LQDTPSSPGFGLLLLVLLQFMVFVPASIIIDIIRLSGTSHSLSGRGWLIFLQLLEMAAKVKQTRHPYAQTYTSSRGGASPAAVLMVTVTQDGDGRLSVKAVTDC
jgi:hypothetical protein